MTTPGGDRPAEDQAREDSADEDQPAVLNGVRVLDLGSLFAGPVCATILADFGADVTKVEHPRGDPLRGHGYQKDGHGLWWKILSRNKRCVTLNLGSERGQRMLRQLVEDADVLIESFRPGVMEGWGLSYEALAAINPRLVMARVTGFGQFGPYSARPGFGTLAEAMSGWANMNGQPDGPPTLPPFGMADGVTGLTTAIAVLMALLEARRSGRGQMIDIAIIEPLLFLLGPQLTAFQQLGVVPTRSGNQSPNSAPRNLYRTRDDRWVAVASSTNGVASRVMRLVGSEEVLDEEWFQSGQGRAAHRDEVDAPVAQWIAARDADQVVTAFEEAGAAVAIVYTAPDIVADPQYRALQSFVEVSDPDLGPVLMQNVMFRLGRGGGRIRHTGRSLGQDNESFYAEQLGLSRADVAELEREGVL